MCCCNNQEYYTNPDRGWICPKCGNVYAPFIPYCEDCNRKKEAGKKITIWEKSDE